MMGSNTVGFNAPSRKAIYDQTMKAAGESSKSYEEFVTFDRTLNLNGAALRSTPGSLLLRPFASPVFVNRPLAIQ